MELYSTQQVAEQTGVHYRTLMRWIEQGLVEPAVRGRRGRQTLLSKKAFREVAVLAKLRELLSLQQLRQALDALRAQGHNPLSTGDFAVVRDLRGERSLLKVCERGEVIELLAKHPGQLRLFPVFDIEAQITDTPPVETLSPHAD